MQDHKSKGMQITNSTTEKEITVYLEWHGNILWNVWDIFLKVYNEMCP